MKIKHRSESIIAFVLNLYKSGVRKSPYLLFGDMNILLQAANKHEAICGPDQLLSHNLNDKA
jgi:hypothetical protein